MIVRGDRAIRIRNSASEIGAEHAHFVILKADLEDELFGTGMGIEDVIGVWHTHPSGISKPSEFDMASWPGRGLQYFVVTQHQVTEWKNVGGKPVLIARASSGMVDRLLEDSGSF